jgi:hypothetical protein
LEIADFGLQIAECGMTDRGCLPAIASRSGEAGGESRSHKFGLFWSIGVLMI